MTLQSVSSNLFHIVRAPMLLHSDCARQPVFHYLHSADNSCRLEKTLSISGAWVRHGYTQSR